MSVTEIAIFLSFGFFVAVYGTMIGAGGGFIMVPIFLLVFRYDPQHTVGTSLAVVFSNAAGTISYMRQKRIDYRTGIQFAIAAIPGALIGAFLARFFTSTVFSIAFGVLLLGIAFFSFFEPVPKKKARNTEDTATELPKGYVTGRFVDTYRLHLS